MIVETPHGGRVALTGATRFVVVAELLSPNGTLDARPHVERPTFHLGAARDHVEEKGRTVTYADGARKVRTIIDLRTRSVVP